MSNKYLRRTYRIALGVIYLRESTEIRALQIESLDSSSSLLIAPFQLFFFQRIVDVETLGLPSVGTDGPVTTEQVKNVLLLDYF